MKSYKKFLHYGSIITKAYNNTFNGTVAIEFYHIIVKAWYDYVSNALFITV